jgi:hypothetical protein
LNLSSPQDACPKDGVSRARALAFGKRRVTSVQTLAKWPTGPRALQGPTRLRLARRLAVRQAARETLYRAYDSVFKDRGSRSSKFQSEGQ